MGAIGLLGYLGEISATNRAVDELIVADGVKPLRFTVVQGSATYSLNANGLDSYLTTTMSKLQNRIDTAQPYKIELQYQVLNINQTTGQFTGFQATSGNFRTSGSFSGAAATCPEMGSMLTTATGSSSSSGASMYAVPRPPSGYLPMSIMVGVRVLRDLSGAGVGQLYKFITQQPLTVSSCKVVVLRGEVEG
jgi:hypothetical protein